MSSADKQPGEGADRPPVEGAGAAGAVAAQDPKNVAELTNYIQSMLQQMQDRLVVCQNPGIVSLSLLAGSRPCRIKSSPGLTTWGRGSMILSTTLMT